MRSLVRGDSLVSACAGQVQEHAVPAVLALVV